MSLSDVAVPINGDAEQREYDRILTLRALNRRPNWCYELVEIPKALLERAQHGDLKMKHESRQMPKPGSCRVRDVAGNEIFQLYFDGGSERKLQVKALFKSNCLVHGTLDFTIPPEKDPCNYSGTPTSVIPYRALEPDFKVYYLTIPTTERKICCALNEQPGRSLLARTIGR